MSCGFILQAYNLHKPLPQTAAQLKDFFLGGLVDQPPHGRRRLFGIHWASWRLGWRAAIKQATQLAISSLPPPLPHPRLTQLQVAMETTSLPPCSVPLGLALASSSSPLYLHSYRALILFFLISTLTPVTFVIASLLHLYFSAAPLFFSPSPSHCCSIRPAAYSMNPNVRSELALREIVREADGGAKNERRARRRGVRRQWE